MLLKRWTRHQFLLQTLWYPCLRVREDILEDPTMLIQNLKIRNSGHQSHQLGKSLQGTRDKIIRNRNQSGRLSVLHQC